VKFDRTTVEVLHNHKKNWKDKETRSTDYGPSICRTTIRARTKKKKEKKITMQIAGAVQSTLNPCEAHIVYECTNKRDLVRFFHAADFSPVQDTWLKAIRAGNFATWPGLTKDLVRTHLPKEIATVKGHLSQRRKNLRSTTATVATPVMEATEPDDPTPATTNIKTHKVFAALVDVGKVYCYLTG
jgi:hypothetical protein